jgi:hypothetical protein
MTMHYVMSGDYSLAQAAEILRSAALTPAMRDQLHVHCLRGGSHFASWGESAIAVDSRRCCWFAVMFATRRMKTFLPVDISDTRLSEETDRVFNRSFSSQLQFFF